MLRTTLIALAALGLSGVKLSTSYAKSEKGLRITTVTSLDLETTSSEMTIDGEPVEGRGIGGSKGSMRRRIVEVDTVLEAEDGAPTKVRRLFEDVGGQQTTSFGDQEQTRDMESPFEGVTLELERGADGVEVKVVEGTEPDGSDALKYHELEFALDALLPGDERDVGDKWDLEQVALRRALLVDLTKALFPPPAEEESAGGGGERRRGGGRSSRTSGRLFDLAEWSGTAEFSDKKEEKNGVECLVIELEIRGEGELPAPEMGGGRRGGMFEMATFTVVGNEFEIELEGRLYFDPKNHRPVELELEGSAKIETEMERETQDGGTMRMRSTQEGALEHGVTITEVAE